MIIEYPKTHTEVTKRICPFHQENPNESYAGCTCTMSYVSVIEYPEKTIVDPETQEKMPPPGSKPFVQNNLLDILKKIF